MSGGPLVLRLFALSFVPFIAVGLLVGGAIGDSNRFGRDAAAARWESEQLRAAIDLHVASIDERIATESVAAGMALGLSATQVRDVLGFDAYAQMRSARERVDAQRARSTIPAVDFEEIDALRRRFDDPDPAQRPAIAEVRAVYDRIHDLRSTDYRRRLSRLIATDTDALADSTSRQLLLCLERLTTAYTGGTWQLEFVGAMLVPGSMPTAEARRRLIEWTKLYEESIGHLEETLDGPVREVWTTTAGLRAPSTPFGVAVDEAVAAEPSAPFSPPGTAFGPIIRSGIERADALYQMIDVVGDELLAAIDAAVAENEREVQRELGVVATVVAATMLLSFVTARSVVHPLLRLARRARGLRDGEIDGDPLTPTGPREVRVVTEAFNEAVANLQTVQAVTAALALGDTEAAGASAVPGGIGRTLRGAIDRLTQSMRRRDELEATLHEQAHRDALTGLHNRWGVEALLDERAARRAAPVGVLFVDLLGFRGINENWGHRTGDLVLQAVAERFVAAAGEGGELARYSGDQWVVVAADADLERIFALADRINASLGEPVVVAGRRYLISCVTGIAVSEPDERARTTIRNADLALAEARRSGPGARCVYDVSLREALRNRRVVEAQLAEALRNAAIDVHYQPVVDAATGALRGVEALARWRDATGRLHPPSEFVPIAEESDLIVELDRFVLRRAAETCAAWRRASGFEELHVAVNVSARHITAPHFVEHITDVLDLTRLDPCALVLEITESVLLTDLQQVCERMSRLRSLGVRVAIDDFGTGFTSVGQLRLLPIDVLKIDRSFIGDDAGPNDRAIVPLVAQVGRALQLEVVAEGVETEHQRTLVVDAGCDLVQGYLTGRPMTATRFAETFGIRVAAEEGVAASGRAAD